jgi:hypothetical protein
MSGRNDVVLSFAIFFIFFILISINLLLISLEELKKDFVKYRCVPVFMPFVGVIGENPVTNFAFCVQDLLGKFIPDLLAPLHLSDNILTKNIGGLLNSLKSLRAFLNKIRTMITEIIQLIMSIFLFLVVGIQEISISLKDLFSKTIATAFVFRYILEGGKLTGESAWNGVPGKAIKGLASMCFHPNTLVKLENGTCKLISNIEVGDILKNGQLVYGTMKLHNLDNNNNYIEKLYKFPGEFYDNKIHEVLVSGSHLIYNNITEKFMHVKHHPDAILTTIDTKLLICLITSDHTIPIGDLIYHDWEDKQQPTS